MYRLFSLFLLFIGVVGALAFTAMFISSGKGEHLKVAVALWFGVGWYYKFRKRNMSTQPSAKPLDDERSDFAISVPVMIGMLVALVVPHIAFGFVGWHDRSGIGFLSALLGGTFALMFLIVVVLVRSHRRGSSSAGKSAGS